MMRRFGFFAVFFLITQNAFCQYFGEGQPTEPSDQFFEQYADEQDSIIEEQSLSEMIFGTEAETSGQGTTFFEYDIIQEQEIEEPDMGEDAGNPDDPAPIDQWLFILPISAVLIAIFFLRKNKEVEV